ncbi:MAG: dihydrodipicolinate synthase family protein [Kiritimatiellae bacterium]|nr:dihydrodipicolinate synthase family protein [Kiritimatiellia bacterium]
MAIPAVPLALCDDGRTLDTLHQTALVRYYIDAGAGGIAVAVHSTQFEIRDPDIALFEPVLALASRTCDEYGSRQGRRLLKIAGVCGKTPQAKAEASIAVKLGYHAALLSLGAWSDAGEDELIRHCRAVAAIMPVFGFYLQTSVGGRALPYSFWRRFAEIENVIGIKMAPFNRYQTFDVVRAVCDAGREKETVLYTGNDDNIVNDLLTEYAIQTATGERRVRIAGGLLGHWSVWTQKSVELLEEVKRVRSGNGPIPAALLTRAVEITDANAAFFDAANKFNGCIPGIHEVLRRQGLMGGIRCLNPKETLSPGQAAEIDRVYRSYPHLNDDDFVKANLAKWLRA